MRLMAAAGKKRMRGASLIEKKYRKGALMGLPQGPLSQSQTESLRPGCLHRSQEGRASGKKGRWNPAKNTLSFREMAITRKGNPSI